MAHPKVVIVMARCSHSKQGFGIRVEEKSSQHWVADWAFAIKEAAAKREGYDRSEIAGSFEIDAAYPGCPHCEESSFVKCGSCGKVACWDGKRTTHTCPWCGCKTEISGSIKNLSVGKDL
ncbi:hypothetical protein F7734_32650 [Scytonema sp. UIC 10036]|uniref:TerY-C metal binding domain-containing protein n=1 Tax=Scytonema sp. UIC 10036 TaxID=2304196 RepID=UPI0012DAD169|nr:TerY-C metal binding domain-containing protein [Scytonema sp. UIC 10036]MUG96837.1 hypothetical protein [Scytonema sp. UIC 10036]